MAWRLLSRTRYREREIERERERERETDRQTEREREREREKKREGERGREREIAIWWGLRGLAFAFADQVLATSTRRTSKLCFFIALICTTSSRIPTSASTDQVPEQDGLMPLGGGGGVRGLEFAFADQVPKEGERERERERNRERQRERERERERERRRERERERDRDSDMVGVAWPGVCFRGPGPYYQRSKDDQIVFFNCLDLFHE